MMKMQRYIGRWKNFHYSYVFQQRNEKKYGNILEVIGSTIGIFSRWHKVRSGLLFKIRGKK